MGWDVDIVKLAEKQGGTIDQAARAINLEVLSDILRNTPVDRGETKGAVITSIGTPDVSKQSNLDKTTGDAAGIARAQSTLSQSGGTVFYITINKPWIRTLEFGGYGTGPGATNKTTRDGFSIQAPNGLLRLAVINVKNGIKEIINK